MEVEADDDIQQGNIICANANLMKSLGRAFWKVSDVLLKHQKAVKEKSKHQAILAVGSIMNNFEKDKLIVDVMRDRLYGIEKDKPLNYRPPVCLIIPGQSLVCCWHVQRNRHGY